MARPVRAGLALGNYRQDRFKEMPSMSTIFVNPGRFDTVTPDPAVHLPPIVISRPQRPSSENPTTNYSQTIERI
jgi:hypothetical protein